MPRETKTARFDSVLTSDQLEVEVMRRTAIPTILFALSVSVAATIVTPAQQVWTGFVTDTHCGTNCQVTKNMTPDLECIRECVRKGSKYGLWVGNRVYALDPQNGAAKFAAKNVRVRGTLDGDTIHAASMEIVSSSGIVRK
jgi:hypothetical protein